MRMKCVIVCIKYFFFFFFFGAYEMCYGAFVTSSCWSRDGCID